MATLSHSVSVWSDGSLRFFDLDDKEPSAVPLWQHKEDMGVFGYIRDCAPCPAVFPMTGDLKTEITEQWQYYVRAINPGMSLQHVSALFGPRKAFTNRHPDDLRADWLKRENLDRSNPDWDKVRTCSLSVLTGTVVGDKLRVLMMDGTKPPALKEGKHYPRNVNEINKDDYLYLPRTHRHLFAVANIVKADGRVVPFDNGAFYEWTGDNRPYTFIPHISRVEISYPLRFLTALPAGSGVPSPYR